MGYHLQGVLGTSAVLAPGRGFAHARVVALGQGICLLPMTDELHDEVRRDGAGTMAEFWKLPAGFDDVLAAWSERGPVAYVEAEYFGGVGTQAAAVWDAGRLVLGPVIAEERDEADPSPISRALRRLGVSAGDHVDEFDAVGLGRHRDLDDWLDEVDRSE
jgi:hypothetical protein